MSYTSYIDTLNNVSEEAKIKIINTLDQYENKWWLSSSHAIIAYGQLNEDILVMPFTKFHEALEKTLNAPVQTIEFVAQDALVRELDNKLEELGLLDFIKSYCKKKSSK